MPGLLFAFGSATSGGSNSCRHGQFHFDLDRGNEGDFELKAPCDKARFFGFLKQADGPVTIFMTYSICGSKHGVKSAHTAM
jgi:hypothetical protein